MESYQVVIKYTKPQFGNHIIFLQFHHVKTDRGEEYLKKIFAETFKEAHPEWSMMKITITKE